MAVLQYKTRAARHLPISKIMTQQLSRLKNQKPNSSGQLPKKSMGQHWLNDEASLQAMCDIAEVAIGDVVLEVGPGHGTLSERLLAHGAQVIAVEKR